MKKGFLESIHVLRTKGEMVLFIDKKDISKEEEADMKDFLQGEWDNEMLEYSDASLVYNPNAALWAAKTVYFTTHYLLVRKDNINNISKFVKPYENVVDKHAVLSADLCLRFLPDLYKKLKQIDNEDELLPLLDEIFKQFSYSSISLNFDCDNFAVIDDEAFIQMMVDRVIMYKAYHFLKNEKIRTGVEIALGNYKNVLWPGLDVNLINKEDKNDSN